jgi:hypothetical protein
VAELASAQEAVVVEAESASAQEAVVVEAVVELASDLLRSNKPDHRKAKRCRLRQEQRSTSCHPG